ncbi:hypothetical protein ACFLXZ_02210, partial [Chloroflexota bacterium]
MIKIFLREYNISTNVVFAYVETISMVLFGYIFWIVITKIGNPEIIGDIAAIASFGGLLAIITAMGIPAGIARFLGIFYARQDSENFTNHNTLAMLITGLATLLGISLVMIFRQQLREY